MYDKTAEFFQDLGRRGREPMLGNLTATIRFDIDSNRQTSTWRLVVDQGYLEVSTTGGAADCVVTADKTEFDRIAGDGRNAMAAVLCGEIAVTGDPEVMVTVQRLFPAPGRVLDTGQIAAGRRLPSPSPLGGRRHDV